METFNDPILKERRQELRRNQTNTEKILWEHLRNRQIEDVKFFRQYSVGPYILDFFAPKHRLCIELDGAYHLEQEQTEYDNERTKTLQALNITVIRFKNEEVTDKIETTLQKIKSHIKQTPS